jgi:hypothetical protein
MFSLLILLFINRAVDRLKNGDDPVPKPGPHNKLSSNAVVLCKEDLKERDIGLNSVQSGQYVEYLKERAIFEILEGRDLNSVTVGELLNTDFSERSARRYRHQLAPISIDSAYHY